MDAKIIKARCEETRVNLFHNMQVYDIETNLMKAIFNTVDLSDITYFNEKFNDSMKLVLIKAQHFK